MFDIVIDGIKKLVKSRLFLLGVLYVIGFGILVNRIFILQIVRGEQYQQTNTYKDMKKIEIKGTRANIYDRAGKLLAYNKLSYAVSIEDTGKLKKSEDKNAMIDRLIKLIEENGGSIVDNFSIKMNEDGELEFTVEGNSLKRFKRDVYSLTADQELSKEQQEADAKQVFDYLRNGNNSNSMFNISSKYSEEDALKIMAIRYAVFMNRYQQYLSVTVAAGVNDKTVVAIKENSEELPGVGIIEETRRVYKNSKYFSHILGYTGYASDAELQELGKSYSATDQVGKSGLEKEYEKYLRGKKGYQQVTVDDTGKILNVLKKVNSKSGDDVYLTLDSDLQITTYNLLERKIANIVESNIVNSNSYGSKGKSSDKITIPIYDVYYALINNNIIDISRFNKKDATALEKNVYQKFVVEQKSSMGKLENLLSVHSKTPNSKASEEMEDLLNYVYKTLKTKDILLTDKIDTDDEYYKNYADNKISLSLFIQHAISSNWINLSKLSLDDKYYSTEEIYSKLLDYVIEILKSDSEFNKMIYHSLVYSHKLSGTEICLLLFDQDVLKYNKDDINALKSNGANYAYSFMKKKIKKLEITPAQLALQPCSGSVVITDVKTGEVRALVSYPSYDNNRLANNVDATYYKQLINDKSFPLLNRPTQQATAPGSTYKMLTSVTGLEEGVIGPNTKILDKGVFKKVSTEPRCWAYPNHTHGKINVSGAIRDSCNYFFYEVGYRLGQDANQKYNSALGLKKIQKYAKMFGLDKKSGIELPETKPNVSNEDAVLSSIGQGSNNYAPIQIARYVATVANGGTSFNLTLLERIKNTKGKIVVDNKAKVYNKINVQESTWDSIHKGMYLVVNSATSSIKPFFKDLDVKVAGKTGTAQITKTQPNHALFVSYAPYQAPEISVVAVIPNGYTSKNSAELGSQIYKYYYGKKDKKSLKKLLDGNTTPSINTTGITD